MINPPLVFPGLTYDSFSLGFKLTKNTLVQLNFHFEIPDVLEVAF